METLVVGQKSVITKSDEILVYEVLNGKNLYYKNYQKVLLGQLSKEEIMGSSSLQSVLVYTIGLFLGLKIDRKKYFIATSEAGVQLGKDKLAIDIAIYEREGLKLDTKYFPKAPKIAIEIDVKIEVPNEQLDEIEYVFDKSDKLLDNGTEKVIWFLTKNKKIVVTEKGEIGKIYTWNQAVEIMSGISLNLNQLLKEEDIVF